ncbi:MAG: hypothetical protein R2712_06195 [Vicinamibacterales bacterium]
MPVGLTAEMSDTVLHLTWLPPPAGPVPAAYVVEAASTPAGPFAAVADVFETDFRVSQVPAGTWYARVRARTAAGAGTPSAVVGLTATPCTAAPEAPGALEGLFTARVLDLQWTAGTGGAAPAAYVIEVGSASGLSDLARIPTATADPSYQATVPPGVYVVRVRARNACGESAPSNERLLVIL